MSYHPRIETPDLASFLTTRSRNSELWFVNNPVLENSILGYAAKFAQRYEVKIYALAIEGNHIQGPALFPKANRSKFMRDLNSCIARAVGRDTPEYPGGRFWARRYSSEFLPGKEDIEEYFFYTVLQQVKDGLVERISEYPGYNCFSDAVNGVTRKFKIFRLAEYNAALRNNQKVHPKDFYDIVYLKYERLPGYENLSQEEYSKLMHEKLEKRRVAIVNERRENGLGFMGRSNLLKRRRGSLPKNTKLSDINSHRPRVLSICPKRRAQCKAWYFNIYFDYKVASEKFRSGKLDVVFPMGTFRPYSKLDPPQS